tara:strand:- start:402 stop:1208 length:807 start_codon:yes stop_codon:yes gene_type:complete
MKKLEVLRNQIAELEVVQKNIRLELSEANTAKNSRIEKVISKYFLGSLPEDVTIESTSDSGTTFNLPHPDYSQPRAILDLRFDKENWSSQEIDDIRASFYSTNESSVFELTRMTIIGIVGRVLLDSSEEIKKEVNLAILQVKDINLQMTKELMGVEKSISEKESEIKSIEMDLLLEQALGDGLEYTPEPDDKYGRSLPSIEVRYNSVVENISKLKVEKISASGKTATISGSSVRYTWDGEMTEYPFSYDKVKMDNIKYCLKRGKNVMK